MELTACLFQLEKREQQLIRSVTSLEPCPLTFTLSATPSQYVTSHQVNSAFHPSAVGKLSTCLLAGVKAGLFTCVG